ncbi:MAG: sigma 54-interacting transcriptional regulator [Planctomycetes bacterium]|nr:sigma 54-interacting transcriptional regulator [Planctomycetota bacterium]
MREPAILAADGLQRFDEVSIELAIDLVRRLADPSGPRPPVAIALGVREEGPAAPLLRELSRLLLKPGSALVVSLGPRGPADALRLFRSRRGRGSGPAAAPGEDGLDLFQETGGSPARIVERAAGAAPAAASEPAPEPKPDAGHAPAATLSPAAFDLLQVLCLLDRPASAEELARLAGAPRAKAAKHLGALRAARLVVPAEPAAPARTWIPSPRAASALAGRPSSAEREAHRRIARRLERDARGPDDPALVEASRHHAASGDARAALRLGLPAARHLKATYRSRAALALFRDLLGLVPRRQEALRRTISLEMSALHACTGDLDEGIRILREVHLRSRRSDPSRWEVLLELAVLHNRRGELRHADALFREGFARLDGGGRARRALGTAERLRFLNEHASLKAFLGDLDEATRICEEGLRLAARSRSLEAREGALNLYATRATVALRGFDFASAARDFERALGAAEALGSLGNQAVTLNNLGKVYSQCDRYAEAVAAFREAERVCLRIDEGPSLVAIHSNLAVLHAKLGDYAATDAALAEAERISAAAGPRERFFLSHARGLARLFQGRYAEARAALEAAVERGRTLGDRHVVEFDEVYRAEALAFEGRHGEADAELRRLAETAASARVRRMALARRAFLGALRGRQELSSEAAAACERLDPGPAVPFLDAWDALFLGWALAFGGRCDESLERLRAGEGFFRRAGLRVFESLARALRAEAHLAEAGRDGVEGREAVEAAKRLVAAVEPRGHGLLAALKPLLEARVLLEGGPALLDRERCAALFAEAGSALASNPLADLSRRLEALRRAAGSAAPGAATSRGPADPGARTASREREPRGRLRDRLVARSAGMRRLLEALDRLRGSELPVLIEGETGSGKELVARVVHAESRRAAGPFLVFDCAAVPEGLLETELAGARAGAYTDQARDHQGILELARGGTVLFEGIDALSLEAQAKLLRIVSEKAVRPVGAEREVRLDVRLLFSTSRDLEAEALAGRLRTDLLHRVRVVTLRVPPLRDRPEDLTALAKGILAEGSGAALSLSEAAWRRLREHPWPGNVRELQNVLARLRLEGLQEASASDVERALGGREPRGLVAESLLAADGLDALKDRLERDYVLYHYRRLRGDTRGLCAHLGLSRRQLYNRLKRLGIALREERKRLGG